MGNGVCITIWFLQKWFLTARGEKKSVNINWVRLSYGVFTFRIAACVKRMSHLQSIRGTLDILLLQTANSVNADLRQLSTEPDRWNKQIKCRKKKTATSLRFKYEFIENMRALVVAQLIFLTGTSYVNQYFCIQNGARRSVSVVLLVFQLNG